MFVVTILDNLIVLIMASWLTLTVFAVPPFDRGNFYETAKKFPRWWLNIIKVFGPLLIAERIVKSALLFIPG